MGSMLFLLIRAYSIGAYIISLQILVAAAASSSCNYSAQICGGVLIPYPFGMTSECGLPDYRISCKLHPSYGADQMPFLQVGTPSTPELQVLSFSNTSNTITVNSTHLKAMPNATSCYGVLDAVAVLDLSPQGPFVLSEGNMFAVIGCNSTGSCVDSSSHSNPDERFSIMCTNGCYNQYDFRFCNDYACCSSAIPAGSRYLKFTGNGIAYADFPGICGFSTVLNPLTYRLDKNQNGIFGAGEYGMSILWALTLNASENCTTARTRLDYACSDHAQCVYNSTVPGYTCNCKEEDGFRGDGYTHGTGCEDIDECKEGKNDCESPPLGICTNTVGSYYCSCASGTTGSGRLGSCVAGNKTKIVLPTVLGGLAGAFCLSVLMLIVCVSQQAYRRKQEREENFYRNGGAELRSILFSEDELKRITKNFSRDHELAKGGYGTVYWGKLSDNCKVAIKKAKHMEDAEREEEQMKSFVSEILLLGKTTHENVVRLLGCCVETRVPLLVYEFIENGTLWDHLHPNRSEEISSLLGGSWARRLHIAVGTAKALSYLHKMSPPILHRDIKSSNILIDKSYSAKVADFGASRFLTSGATHLTFAFVVGTHGYLDPEYYRSCQFTEKSDVYSFGVVLLELITAMPADLGTNFGVLAYHFHNHFKMKRHTDLIDSRLGKNADVLASIQDVAELAMDCLAMEGNQRPTMEEVLRKLKRAQAKRGLQDIQSLSTHELGTTSAVHSQQIISAGNSEERSLLSSRQYSSNASSSEIALISSSDWS